MGGHDRHRNRQPYTRRGKRRRRQAAQEAYPHSQVYLPLLQEQRPGKQSRQPDLR